MAPPDLPPQLREILLILEATKNQDVKERIAAFEGATRLVDQRAAELEAQRLALDEPIRHEERLVRDLLVRLFGDLVLFTALKIIVWVVFQEEHLFPGPSNIGHFLGLVHGFCVIGVYAVLAVSIVWDLMVQKFGLRQFVRLGGRILAVWLRSRLRKAEAP